jgi:putative ABC transport system substrate-binding protein
VIIRRRIRRVVTSAAARRVSVGRRVVSLVTLVSVMLLATAASAQPRLVKIGWLTTGPHPFLQDFRGRLRELGYVEGRTIAIEQRDAGEQPERLGEMAAELVRDKVDVLVVSGGRAGRIVRDVVTSIPVVSVSGDPVGAGIVASLARPGGNITGLAIVSDDLAPKWLEFIREAVPRVRLVAILQDPGGSPGQAAAADAAARRLGMRSFRARAQNGDQIDEFFRAAARERAGAAVVLSSPFFASEKERIVALAARHRLPTLYEHRDFVDAGGLMSYGPDLREVFIRAADYVDRILKGARPADMPIEQPTRFQLVVNLKTAAALRLTLPPALLSRADEVLK